MGERISKNNGSSKREEEVIAEPVENAEAAEHKEQLDNDIDAILDEIDDVLEINAEEFVKSYIQKGGQ